MNKQQKSTKERSKKQLAVQNKGKKQQQSSKKENKNNQRAPMSKKESGTDYLQPLTILGKDDLVDGLGPLLSMLIKPASLPNTRCDIISKTYQYFRYNKFVIKYTPSIPDSVNATYQAFYDSDPKEELEYSDASEIQKIAKAHKGSKILKANKPWIIDMPKFTNKWFYNNTSEDDKRLTSQAKFYLFQVGTATNFNGEEITKQLKGGDLTIDWEIEFKNPQLSELNRLYDGSSQKSLFRVFKQVNKYRRFDVVATFQNCIVGSKYRTVKVDIPKELIDPKKSYLLQITPYTTTLPNTVKNAYIYAPDFYDKNSDKSFGNLIADGITTVQNLEKWIQKAFKTVEGGIAVATKIFDVMALGVSLLAGYSDVQTTGTQVDVTYDSATTKLEPIGYNVITYDGKQLPFIEFLFEFKDNAHAVDTTVVIDAKFLVVFYELLPDEVNLLKPLATSKIPYRVI